MFRILLLIVSCCLGSSFLYGAASISVLEQMNFGEISYDNVSIAEAKVVADRKLLVSKGVAFSNKDVKMAKILVKGLPKEVVSIELLNGLMQGNVGDVLITDVIFQKVKNRKIRLNNSGRAVFYVLASMSIKRKGYSGDYLGGFFIRANFLSQKRTFQVKVPSRVRIKGVATIEKLVDLDFGVVEKDQNAHCFIVVAQYRSADRSSCVTVSGGLTPAKFRIGKSFLNSLLNAKGIDSVDISKNIRVTKNIVLTGEKGGSVNVALVVYVETNDPLYYTVLVGGRADFFANLADGLYQGSFTLTLDY